ncbi:transglycosylase SLT domain-containing protein [Glaciecola sp. 1036]|uniref:lytic transglycosylase domain-containing protein n=1 Tax=Alteromonadaceae TaxID=72275 RepID=UPI003D07AEDA
MVSNSYAQSKANQETTSTPQVDQALRDSQRAAFLRLDKRLWNMSDEELVDAIQDIGDYPLNPYLIAKKLTHRISLSRTGQIRDFLLKYDGTPLDRLVRTPWLEYLKKRNKDQLFMQFYRNVYDTELACYDLDLRYQYSQDKEAVFNEVADFWNVGKSQPKTCDPVFKAWMQAGLLTEDLILQRIEKAANGGTHTLIPYLTTLLPEDKKYLAEAWHKVRRNPATVAKLNLFNGRYQMIESSIVTYALTRLIWRDADLALKTYERAKNAMVFSQAQTAKIANQFAVSLALNEHKQAEKWLTKAGDVAPQEDTLRWHLALLLRNQEWQKIILLIEKSQPQYTHDLQFQYWLARAYELVGRNQDATSLYRQLASARDYYGFLSSARLGVDYSFEHQPLSPSQEDLDLIRQSGFAQRAYELRKIGRDYWARLEWLALKRSLNQEQQLATAVVSSEWGWHDQTIRTLGDLRELNDVERRFPIAYADLIVPEAKKNNIQPEWSLAIARRESSFMPDAISSVDARGLMQVLPSTARYLEKRRVSSSELLEPDFNARVGNKYLRYLLNKLDGNTLLATASYNAGWRRVLDWLPEDNAIDADIWIELIPYRETRNYVKAVMAYQQIYQRKLSDEMPKHTVFSQLASSQIEPRSS